jgi:hypothetical protein
MTATFDHRDGGTPETAWTNDTQLAHLPPARPPAQGAHLLVLAAHPDDETLGAGGLIAIAAHALVSRVCASLTAAGVLAACHLRHPAVEHPRTASEIHDALARELNHLVHHVEDDFFLDVWCATGESVARANGIFA